MGKDRESHQRDLYESIERGDFPRWTMYVQLMTEEEARNYKLNPFDLTKVWYHKDFPLHEVGVLELNRNPENYYADVEQAAFNPMNIVEGIGFSPDKMLQGRLFSYGDAQRYRLGVNHTEIPVNRPRCPIHAFHRDGQMRTDGNYGSAKGYEPNSYGEWQDTPALKEPPLAVNGDVYNYDERELDSDYFTQPGLLWRVMSAEDQKATCENTARAMAMPSCSSSSATRATATMPTRHTAREWPRRWASRSKRPSGPKTRRILRGIRVNDRRNSAQAIRAARSGKPVRTPPPATAGRCLKTAGEKTAGQ